MPLRIFLVSLLLNISFPFISEADQSCNNDYIKLTFPGGRLGMAEIVYYRKGKVTFGPENGEILETKQLDPKQTKSFWLKAEDVAKKVNPGQYGIIESVGNRDTSITIIMCNKIYSYVAVTKGKNPNYSKDLASLLENRP